MPVNSLSKKAQPFTLLPVQLVVLELRLELDSLIPVRLLHRVHRRKQKMRFPARHSRYRLHSQDKDNLPRLRLHHPEGQYHHLLQVEM